MLRITSGIFFGPLADSKYNMFYEPINMLLLKSGEFLSYTRVYHAYGVPKTIFVVHCLFETSNHIGRVSND